MGRGAKTTKRLAFVGGTMFVCLSAAACAMLHARGDSERIDQAERVRCTHWNGQARGTLLGQTAVAEIRRVLAEAVTPARAVTPLTKGSVLGLLTLEGPGTSTRVQVFFEPRWVEVDDRYYKLTEAELDALRRVVEAIGPDLRGREYERIP